MNLLAETVRLLDALRFGPMQCWCGARMRTHLEDGELFSTAAHTTACLDTQELYRRAREASREGAHV